MSAREGIYHYARIDALGEWLSLGWMFSHGLGIPHGVYSVMVFWPCECPAKTPVRQ